MVLGREGEEEEEEEREEEEEEEEESFTAVDEEEEEGAAVVPSLAEEASSRCSSFFARRRAARLPALTEYISPHTNAKERRRHHQHSQQRRGRGRGRGRGQGRGRASREREGRQGGLTAALQWWEGHRGEGMRDRDEGNRGDQGSEMSTHSMHFMAEQALVLRKGEGERGEERGGWPKKERGTEYCSDAFIHERGARPFKFEGRRGALTLSKAFPLSMEVSTENGIRHPPTTAKPPAPLRVGLAMTDEEEGGVGEEEVIAALREAVEG